MLLRKAILNSFYPRGYSHLVAVVDAYTITVK